MLFSIVCIVILLIIVVVLANTGNSGTVSRPQKIVARNTGSRSSLRYNGTSNTSTDSMYMFTSNGILQGDNNGSNVVQDGESGYEEDCNENCDCGCNDSEFDGDSGNSDDCCGGYDSDGGYDSGDSCDSDSDSDSDSD